MFTNQIQIYPAGQNPSADQSAGSNLCVYIIIYICIIIYIYTHIQYYTYMYRYICIIIHTLLWIIFISNWIWLGFDLDQSRGLIPACSNHQDTSGAQASSLALSCRLENHRKCALGMCVLQIIVLMVFQVLFQGGYRRIRRYLPQKFRMCNWKIYLYSLKMWWKLDCQVRLPNDDNM